MSDRNEDTPKPATAKCKKCGEVIISRSRHDFVTCACGESFVDGGYDYCRYGGQAVPEDGQ